MPSNPNRSQHLWLKPFGRSGVVFAALVCMLVITGCGAPSSPQVEEKSAAADSKADQFTLQKNAGVLKTPAAKESAAVDPEAQALSSTKNDKTTSGPVFRCASPTSIAKPSWPGKQVRFAFDFQNAGDEVLTLKAKAG